MRIRAHISWVFLSTQRRDTFIHMAVDFHCASVMPTHLLRVHLCICLSCRVVYVCCKCTLGVDTGVLNKCTGTLDFLFSCYSRGTFNGTGIPLSNICIGFLCARQRFLVRRHIRSNTRTWPHSTAKLHTPILLDVLI